MKMTRYSEPQILAILRQAEGGVPVAELCREHGMSTASFYKWRAKYGGMDGLCCTNQLDAEFSLLLNGLIPRTEFAVFQGLWSGSGLRL